MISKSWSKLRDLSSKKKLELQKKSEKKFKIQKNNFIKTKKIDFDFSRQHVNESILETLIYFAKESKLIQKRESLYSGKENALHVILRGGHKEKIVSKHPLEQEINRERERMLFFAEDLNQGKVCGWSNKPIKEIIVFGFGGSILAPKLVFHALRSKFGISKINICFFSNPDGIDLNNHLENINAEQTLFLIQSKSLSTPEIDILVKIATNWLKEKSCPDNLLQNQFVVITSNIKKAKELNFKDQKTFKIWNDVGGRFSIWSSMGLTLAILIGTKKFYDFLDGAREMDDHFYNTEPKKNIPIISALIAIWNRSFLNLSSQLISNYSSQLDYLVPYIQQIEMESLGKSVNQDDEICKYHTGGIVWGGSGIEGQHSYYQFIHQGTIIVPVDFFGLKKNNTTHSDFIVKNIKAQADSLAIGDGTINFKGNRPSSIYWLNEISPNSLGYLLSFLEHKVFTMGSIWNLNPFNQPGVELGKKMLKTIK